MNPEPPHHRTGIAAELAETARQLSESDLNRARTEDTHALLQDLHTAIDSLKQVAAQLSWWHSRAIGGSNYVKGDESGPAIEDAAAQLLSASRFLSAARDAVRAAEAANSEVRWKRPMPAEPTPTADDTDHGSLR